MTTEVKLLDEERMVHTGVYDFDELYKHLWRWLEWQRFDTEENKYREQRTAGADGVESKNVEVIWVAEKDYDAYTKIRIKLRYQLIGIKIIEVQQGPNKVKMERGEVNVYVTASFILDRNDKFKKSPFLHFMQRFYERYLYKDTIETLKKDVWKLGWEIFNESKAFLKLHTFEPRNIISISKK